MLAPILIQNVAGATVTDNIFVGMPDDLVDKLPVHGWLRGHGTKMRYSREPHGVRVHVTAIPPATKWLMQFDDVEDAEPIKFQLHPKLEGGRAAQVLPRFYIGHEEATPVLVELEELPLCRISQWRYHWPNHRVTVDLWTEVNHLSPTIEWEAHAIYGDTRNDGQAQTVGMPQLTMTSPGKIHVDFHTRLGKKREPDFQPRANRFAIQYRTSADRWHRARRYPLSGVIELEGSPGARQSGLKLTGLYTGWDDNWLAFGKVPRKSPDMEGIEAGRLHRYLNQRLNEGRDRAQQEWSGQTGEQVDFGCSTDLAVTLQQPWAIHDARYSAQSFELRPTANREPGGAPMRAVNHPLAETQNQRPDLEWGKDDRLGWPPVGQLEWITGYVTSDDEHRSDLLLHGLYALTRSRALRAVIQDHIELFRTDVYHRHGWAGSPRASGRLIHTLANMKWLGFPVGDLIDDLVDRVDNNATYKQHTGPVRLFDGFGPAKYGWHTKQGPDGKMQLAAWDDPAGVPRQGSATWNNAICAQRMLAVRRVHDNVKSQVIGLEVCRTVVDHGFLWVDGAPRFIHAIGWNHQNPGYLFAPEFYDGQTNENVYIDNSADYWAVACAIVLAQQGYEQAQRICDWYQVERPKTFHQARWYAIQL